MSDPLGLLPTNDQGPPDPLGLLSRPDPFAGQKISQGQPDDEGWEGFKLPLLDKLFGQSAAERTAKSQNIMAISSETGIAPSLVNEHYDDMARAQGFADQPKPGTLFGGIMMATALATPLAPAVGPLAAWASMSVPLRYLQMAKGAAVFQGVVEATNLAVSQIKGKEYKPLSGEGVSSLLPEDTSGDVKSMVDLAEFVAQAFAAGVSTKGGNIAGEKLAARYLRDVTESFTSLPRQVYISPEQVRAHFGGTGSAPGQPGYVDIPPELSAFLKDINISNGQYRSALRNGIDIEIGADKLVHVVDKPWWAEVKGFFKASPYEKTTVVPGEKTVKMGGERAAQAQGQGPGGGLIEGPGSRGYADFLNDVNTVFGGQRGSVTTGQPPGPEKAAAMDRLKSDLATFETKAKEAGKDLTAFLKESGVDEAGVASMLLMKGLPEPDAIKQAFLAGKIPAAESGLPQMLTMSGGPAGAGKSSTIRRENIESNVIVNADKIGAILGRGIKTPETHEASSALAKELLGEAISGGHDTFYDSQLTNFELADKTIQDVLASGGGVRIGFTDIDAETSIVRSAVRKIAYDEKLEGGENRIVPVDVSIKGYDYSLPTFRALYEKYKDNPRVSFIMADNNMDFAPQPVMVFKKTGENLQILDKDLFDNFVDLNYIKTEKDGETRYVRKEQTEKAALDERRIQARIDDGIARKRDDAARRSVAAAASATPYPPSNVTASEGTSLRERGIASQSPETPDDINAVFEMAARSDQAAGSPPTSEYDKIRAEAAKLAFEAITKKIDISQRKLARETARASLDEARNDPVYTAMREAVKMGGMSRSSLAITYDKNIITELVRKMPGLVSVEGGTDYTRISEQQGFDSADEMIEAMRNWRGLKKEAGRYAEQYEEQYGDLLTQAELESFHVNLLEEEAKALRKLLGQKTKPSAPGIKGVIREQTGQTRVDELVVSEYEALKAGMIKSERAARAAFRAGNIDGALAEKERQLEMATERREKLLAKEEANKIHDGLLALTKDRKIPEDYQDRIHDLLEDFDLLPRSKRMGARVESAREFIERQRESGEDVTIPESMLNRIERYGRIHWRELTLDQLREIYDQAKIYAHLGKLKNKLLKAKEGREFEGVVEEIVSRIGENWGVEPVPDADMEKIFIGESWIDKILKFKESYLGSLTKVETYLRRLDGFKDLGPIHELIYMPTKRASDVEYTRLAEITDKLKALFDPIRETLTKDTFKIPGVAQDMTRETVIMVALNSGNKGNLDALKGNKVYGWGDAEIQAILANVTPDEWNLVRGVWDLFEAQYPALAQVYMNLSGTTLKKVEGNYFPLVFDRKLSWIADRNATEKELRDFFQSIYTLPSVKTGSVIERIGGKLPPKLSFQVIFDKLSEINHYTTHAEAVRDVQKILADPRVRAAIEGAPDGIGGPDAFREMKSWLQDVARQQSDPLSALESAVKTARINTTTVAMAWKFSTAAMQFLGATNSIYKVGQVEFAKALAEFYTNREAMVDRIKGMSTEVSGRAKSFDRDLRDAYKRLGLEHFRGSQAIKDSFFSLISLMDMAVAYPTWLAAYNKGMKDLAGDDLKAVEYADMTLRMTQGAGLVKDLAGVQRGSEMKKILSLFYTYFSAYHQMMGDAWVKFKYDKSGPNAWDLMKAWWWLTILPATLEYMLKERDVPTPGKLIASVLQQRLTAYPVVRDITGAMLTDFDYTFSPVAKAGEVTSKLGKEVVALANPDDEVEWDKFLRYSLETSGYLFGLPTGQASITMQGLMDLMNGETSDPTRLLMRQPRGDREE